MTSERPANGLSMALFAAFGAGLVSVFGCYDMSVKLPPPPAQQDAGAGDASEGGAPSACSVCLEGAACQAERASCEAVDGCPQALSCVAERGCYTSDINEVINCAIPCAATEGVFEADDPVVVSGMGLAICLVGECGETCEAEQP